MSIRGATIEETYRLMVDKLARVVPEVELRQKAELVFEINRLKQERGAIILGHNYMEPALYHTVPDVVGDSLELSRKAAQTDKDPIVFCGVRFMAETAKILNPSKTVLLPSKKGGCSLAASITAEDVRALKRQYPGVPVVTYVNCYADVKAETDVCCTSSNAARNSSGRRLTTAPIKRPPALPPSITSRSGAVMPWAIKCSESPSSAAANESARSVSQPSVVAVSTTPN